MARLPQRLRLRRFSCGFPVRSFVVSPPPRHFYFAFTKYSFALASAKYDAETQQFCFRIFSIRRFLNDVETSATCRLGQASKRQFYIYATNAWSNAKNQTVMSFQSFEMISKSLQRVDVLRHRQGRCRFSRSVSITRQRVVD